MSPPLSGQKKRQRLLEAATEILLSEGAESITARKMTEITGISKQSLRRHFEDKQALLRAVLQHLTTPLRASLALNHTAELEMRPQLILFAYRYIKAIYERDLLRLHAQLPLLGQQFPWVVEAFLELSHREVKRVLLDFLRQQRAAEVIEISDPEKAVEQLLGALHGNRLFEAVLTGIAPPESELEALAELAVDNFLHAYADDI